MSRVPPGDYWAKIKGSLHRSVERWEVGLDGIGLWTVCLSYSADNLTDGFVPEEFVKANLPRPDRRQTLASVVGSGLLARTSGGYVVCDYLAHNNSREEILSIKQTRANAGKLGGKAKANRLANAKQTLEQTAGKPLANRLQEVRSKKTTTEEDKSSSSSEKPEIVQLCHGLAALILANDAKAKVAPDSKGWRDAARLLVDKDGRSVAEVEAVMAWACRDEFWRSNILSMPKLREKFPTLLLRMPRRQGHVPRRSTDPMDQWRHWADDNLPGLDRETVALAVFQLGGMHGRAPDPKVVQAEVERRLAA